LSRPDTFSSDTFSLAERLITSVIFIPILFLAVHFGGASFFLMVAGTAIIGLIEFYDLQRYRSNPQYETGIVVSLILCISAFRRIYSPISILVFLIFLSLIIELFKKSFSKKIERHSVVNNVAATIFGVLYVTFLLSHLFFLRERGLRFIYLLFFGTWCADSAAYFVGKKWGRHKLIPKISMHKSIEGAIGGISAGLLVFLIARFWIFDFSLETSLLLGILIGIFAQAGDLVESLLKRDVETKDSGDFIPGHGGLLDRFDSLLFTAPFFYYFLSIYSL